jgi:RND family efflux transporter MFP subunit
MKKLIWLVLVVVVLGAGFGLWRRQSVPTVRVAAAETGTAVDAVTGTVKVFANADLKVQTEIDGRLVEMLVKAGDFVAKGDPLAQQDSLELQYRIEQERVRLEAAEARLALPLSRGFDVENIGREVEALKLEVELGQTPRGRLEQVERELRKLEMLREEEKIQRRESAGILRARVKEMELQIAKMRVTAPFAGEIVEVYAVVGNQLGRNANLVRLVSEGRWAEMVLNEEDFAGAAVGQRVTLRLASFGNREFAGEVSNIAATADADKKTRALWVRILESAELLVPGLTGEAYLVKQERPEAVLVPRRALRGNRLWVVRDGVVELRLVQPGFLSLHRAEILEGLTAGETVVLENQDQLSDGQTVRVAR